MWIRLACCCIKANKKKGWKFLCFRTTCWTRSTVTHRHRFCQRNAEITTSLNQQCARKRMLWAAVISIHQPPRALHPLTASYIKIEMTSKDSIKIKKYKRRYMCKRGCIQNTFWSPHKKKKTPFRKQSLSNSTKHDLKFTTREWSGHSTKYTNKKQKIIIKSGSCRPAQVLTLSLIHVVSPDRRVWISALSGLLSSNVHAFTLLSTGTVSGYQLGHKSRLQ